MRIAVAGATGNIGARTAALLVEEGHDVVPVSRAHGLDLAVGAGLRDALVGVDAVVDVTSANPSDDEEARRVFGDATRALLAAEEDAGVAHHVLLSISGIHRVGGGPHYAGKREQERLVAASSVGWSILPATQFHDFAATVAGWTEHDGTATLPPLLVQPVAPDDVARVLVETVTGEPRGRMPALAGPDPHDLIDMARRTHVAQGRDVRLVPSWAGPLGTEMAGTVMLPDDGARIAPTSFDAWLAGLARTPAH